MRGASGRQFGISNTQVIADAGEIVDVAEEFLWTPNGVGKS
jgi:hypothetical protein